jgi:hypothetical protein
MPWATWRTRPIRSRRISITSGVALGQRAKDAGSPGTRNTIAYFASITVIRITTARPMR